MLKLFILMNKKIIYLVTFFSILALALFLRLYKIDTLLPPYWEEAALGYDAYSISETLRDHHGNFLPLIAFESFGDWKPALYFYTIVPFIKLFGLSILAVRLPSLLAGISIVLGIGVLTKQILSNSKEKSKFELKSAGLLGMFIAAISPWAILFSRAGWEVNLATALVLWGVISFFKFLESKEKPLGFLFLSVIFLSLSMYTYHATRLIAPLLGLGLVVIWFLQNSSSPKIFSNLSNFFYKNASKLAVTLIFTLILTFPLLINLSSSTTSQRFKETSIFSNLEIIKESNLRKNDQPGILSRVFYHRYVLFGREITKNYLSHFNLNFLFFKGDANPRHSIQYMGQLYHLEIIFLLLGFFFLFKTLDTQANNSEQKLQNNFLRFLLFWLLIGIIPASITHASPHALRILPVMPVFIILITLGIRQLFLWFEKIKISSKIFWAILLIIYLGELLMFARFYTKIYPQQYSNEWQVGYQEIVKTLSTSDQKDNQIYISRTLGRPLMYYWFYDKTEPRAVQEWNNIAPKDQGEYLQFQNIKTFDSPGEIKNTPARIALSPQQLSELKEMEKFEIEIIKKITNFAGEDVFVIVEIK
jgi:4-amino-4-deoxy-L-arabinose transferase-like glycosyltransferase